MTRYQNTPTVVVVLVPCNGDLLPIRRDLPGEGQGKLALSGASKTCPTAAGRWSGRGTRATSVVVDPAILKVFAVETTPDRRQNLIFCESLPLVHEGQFAHDHEVSEVLIVHEPIETAFPLHTRMVQTFFERFASSVRDIALEASDSEILDADMATLKAQL